MPKDFFQKDDILMPTDIGEYKSFVDERISKIIIGEKFHYGNLVSSLKESIRRGWIVRGVPYELAETSWDHSVNLKEAGTAFCCNPDADITIEDIAIMFNTHDHVDAIFYDIIPDDMISKEQKLEMETYALDKLYSSLNNGTGRIFMGMFERFSGHKLRSSQIGYILDKQCAATKSREIRNNFEIIENFYKNNPEKTKYLMKKYPEENDLVGALNGLYKRLGEFYENNKGRIKEPFFRHVADEVELIKESDVYTKYFNILSTAPMDGFK